jgi:fructose-specific phosphotransferase system IIC component
MPFISRITFPGGIGDAVADGEAAGSGGLMRGLLGGYLVRWVR